MAKKNTKEIILFKALSLFADKGYDGVTVRDIAAEVGIMQSSLYKHYKNKQEIFDTFTTKIFFFKIILLDHCAHCAIQNQNTLGYNLRNCLFHSYLITLTPNCHSAYLRPITILSYYYAIKPSYRLNIRAMSLRSSFSLIDSRLSYCFLLSVSLHISAVRQLVL